MEKGGGIFYGIVFSFLYPIFVVFFLSTSTLESSVKNQVMLTYDFFGEDYGSRLIKEYNSSSSDAIKNSTVLNYLKKMRKDDYFIGENSHHLIDDGNGVKREASSLLSKMISNISNSIKLLHLMLGTCKPLIPYLLIITLVAAIDGILRREIKKTGFDYSSPFRFGIALGVLKIFMPFFVIYCLVPIYTIEPIFIVFLIVLFGLVINQIFSNLIKRL